MEMRAFIIRRNPSPRAVTGIKSVSVSLPRSSVFFVFLYVTFMSFVVTALKNGTTETPKITEPREPEKPGTGYSH